VGSIPARGQCFFRMRVVKIANCKTYLKNVFLALSRNTPIVEDVGERFFMRLGKEGKKSLLRSVSSLE